MWLTIFILGGIVAALVMALRAKGVSVKWYEYLIAAVALGLGVGAVQHAVSASAVGYGTSAMMGGLIFGLPAIILLAVAWQLVARRHRA